MRRACHGRGRRTIRTERTDMERTIIHIDEERCNGCGICVEACHEGALGLVDGKARLLRDDYCDGLGDCLPACPANAITFVRREAAAYDEAAVMAAKAKQAEGARAAATGPSGGGCPGSLSRLIERMDAAAAGKASSESGLGPSPETAYGAMGKNASAQAAGAGGTAGAAAEAGEGSRPAARPVATAGERLAAPSHLAQWPVQIKLAPLSAPYFQDADLLVAADCTAFAYGDFHDRFMRRRTTLIGCPKLDGVDYAEKLAQIIAGNNVRSIVVARMEVPCCGGLEQAVRRAVQASGKPLDLQVVTVSVDGRLLP